MWPLTSRRERAHDLAHRRREDVDAADDQHVVGAADAAHARAGAAARARARPHLDVVARAEAQQRRRAVAGDASARARRSRRPSSSTARARSGSISSAWTKPRAPRCIPSCSSHSPQSETPMSPIPIASVTFAPQPSSSLRAEGRLAAARLAGDEHALDARAAQVDAALRRPFDEVGGVGRRQHRRLGPQQLDRQHQPLGVPGADRDVAEADPVERGERRAGDERPGVVGRDDPLARRRRPRRRSCAPSR